MKDEEFERIFNALWPGYIPGEPYDFGIEVNEADAERYRRISEIMDESYASDDLIEPTLDGYYFL